MKTIKVLICLAVIALAAGIYKYRFDEQVKSYGGYEMPDFTETATQRYDRLTARAGENIRREAESNLLRIKMELKVKLANIDFWAAQGVTNGPTDRPYRMPE